MGNALATRLAGLLLLAGWLALGAGLLADSPRGGAEVVLRGYLADLEARRLEPALAALTPEAASRYRDFLEFQQLNRYQVLSVAVRSPSLLGNLLGEAAWRANQATLVAEVQEPSGVRWRGSTVVPIVYRDGRYLLARPPFAAD